MGHYKDQENNKEDGEIKNNEATQEAHRTSNIDKEEKTLVMVRNHPQVPDPRVFE